jgi:hypothetical protein
LKGDGTFMSETMTRSEYQPKQGDRYESKRPGSSDIWKASGPILETELGYPMARYLCSSPLCSCSFEAKALEV